MIDIYGRGETPRPEMTDNNRIKQLEREIEQLNMEIAEVKRRLVTLEITQTGGLNIPMIVPSGPTCVAS